MEELAEVAATHGAALKPPIAGAPVGYRHRARLAVRGRASSPKIGIFQEGTHRIADIPTCPVHHPLVNEVAAALRDAMRTTGIEPYADTPHLGVVRYLQVVVERTTGTAQVVVVTNTEDAACVEALAEPLAGRLGTRLQSLWWNGNTARTNTILGPAWRRIRGPEATLERLGGVAVLFPPGAFGQSNLPVAESMVEYVAAQIPDGAATGDVYCGTGAYGLGLLARGPVTFIELSPAGIQGLRLGLERRPSTEHERAAVIENDAAACLDRLGDLDAVILDPPRKGLDDALRDALSTTPPATVVTVHCGFDAFLRDVAALAGGPLEVEAIRPVDLFPFTDHVEVVTTFRRR